jgi:peptidoglycan/LPS O-acetylase OafA/YrhL
MGWIGVDLFFVLSGFLVSGLLFKEYIKFGNIRPALFLIRRGFKIYPIYFLFYIPYIIPIIIEHRFNTIKFLGDMTFTQNYLSGWGYTYAASWSLAVEEHFYFLFAFFLWLVLRFNKNLLHIDSTGESKTKNNFESTVITILIIVLLFRVLSNFIFPEQDVRNFTMTHLRIDSLLFGVLISYLFYFRKKHLEKLFVEKSFLLYIICFCGLLWTPFIDPLPSFFVKTFGFSILYISFGILLIIFLLKSNINNILNNIFTAKIVNIISQIGYCSYSIYIIHSFVFKYCSYPIYILHAIIVKYCSYPIYFIRPAFINLPYSSLFNKDFNHYLIFIVAPTISILSGMFMTYRIERYFLRLRDIHYPSRV